MTPNQTFITRVLYSAALLWSALAGLPDLVAPAQAEPAWGKARQARPLSDDKPLRYGDFKRLAKTLSPAVVFIGVTQTSKVVSPHGFDFFFRTPFDAPPEMQKQGLGTGFIIDADGLIVTNNHVIEKADKITAKLMDGREFEATVVGADPHTDIALLRIGAKGLPTAPLGDSSALEVGDWVMAIGNPFGLEHTVTAGIVSAKGRREVRPERRLSYANFIQTDASINPGNSGGPLINLAGEVIGINTAILGHQNVGVGFAIPINMAKTLLPSLAKYGRARRSWIGINIQEVTAELAASFGMARPHGALINHVVPGGPADKASLSKGDVIVRFNGKEILSSQDLPWLASTAGIGKKASLEVLRNGKVRKIDIVLEEFPDDVSESTSKKGKRRAKGEQTGSGLGMLVAPVPEDMARRYDLKPGRGVIIAEIDQGSAALAAGLRKGDVIQQVDGKRVNSVRGYEKAIKRIPRGGVVRVLVQRGHASIYVAFRKK